MPSDFPEKSKKLRERAKEIARTSETDLSKMSAKDVEHLVYELQIHQIELELQNEELLETQAKLAQARDFYSDLYEYAPVGYLSLTREGEIRQANLTACHLLDRDRNSLRVRGTQFAGSVVPTVV